MKNPQCLQNSSISKKSDNCMKVFSTPAQYFARCLFISRFVNIYLLVRYTGLKTCKKMQQEEFVKVAYHSSSSESRK